jgi:hypothetical protein
MTAKALIHIEGLLAQAYQKISDFKTNLIDESQLKIRQKKEPLMSGYELKEIYDSSGLTRESFCDLIKISPRQFHRLINSEYVIKDRYAIAARRIAKANNSKEKVEG